MYYSPTPVEAALRAITIAGFSGIVATLVYWNFECSLLNRALLRVPNILPLIIGWLWIYAIVFAWTGPPSPPVSRWVMTVATRGIEKTAIWFAIGLFLVWIELGARDLWARLAGTKEQREKFEFVRVEDGDEKGEGVFKPVWYPGAAGDMGSAVLKIKDENCIMMKRNKSTW